MKIMTVKGQISPDELGLTLPHEHLLLDSSIWCRESSEISRKKLADKMVDITNIGLLRIDPYLLKDNTILEDIDLAIEELMYFKRMGGRSLVEMSNIGLGRDVLGMRAISEETGMHVVAGCGYYIEGAIPIEYRNLTDDQLANRVVSEIRDGIGDTGIRPGIIGEIGTTPDLTAFDVKMLRVAAKVQVETGLTISVHNEFSRAHHKILDVLEKEGVDLHRVVLCHLDQLTSVMTDIQYQQSLLERGVYLEYDGFGTCTLVYTYPLWQIGALWDDQFPRDVDKVKTLVKLVEKGFLDQLLISHDTSTKSALKKYGGVGYDHILCSVIPFCKRYGMTDEQVQTILVGNPTRMLSY